MKNQNQTTQHRCGIKRVTVLYAVIFFFLFTVPERAAVISYKVSLAFPNMMQHILLLTVLLVSHLQFSVQ